MSLAGLKLFFDEEQEDLPQKEPEKELPLKLRVNWTPITTMQGKQMFGARYYSKRLFKNTLYKISRERLDESWTELQNPPKGASLEMGRDQQNNNEFVCRMLYYGVDTDSYIHGRLDSQ